MIERRSILSWMGLSLAVCNGAQTDDGAGRIKHLIADYAKSINGADTKLAAQVWLTSPEVSMFHPLGHERGWDQVKTNFYEKLMGGLMSRRNLVVRDITVHVFGDSAVAEFYWHFNGTMRSDGSAVETDGRETQVYCKTDGARWALVHVHYSGVPAQ
jgi:ketosteroid isomerase-like protein